MRIPEGLRIVRVGIVLAIVTMLFGFGMGGVLGLAEGRLRADLDRRGQAVLENVYGGDEANRVEVKDWAWAYYRRAHLHAGAMGTSALAMSMLLSLLPMERLVRCGVSLALGMGGLGYGVSLLLMGMRTPELGSTSLARESLEWLAVPSAGLFLGGSVAVVVLFACAAWSRPCE